MIAPPLQVLGTTIKEKTARAWLFYRTALARVRMNEISQLSGAKVLQFSHIRKQIANFIADFRFTAFCLQFHTITPSRNLTRSKRTQTHYVRMHTHQRSACRSLDSGILTKSVSLLFSNSAHNLTNIFLYFPDFTHGCVRVRTRNYFFYFYILNVYYWNSAAYLYETQYKNPTKYNILPYFGAFWLDLDASNSLKSSKEYTTNITFGYLWRHVSCSGRNLWRTSFLNSTSRNVLPSGLRKLSSGIPLHPKVARFHL